MNLARLRRLLRGAARIALRRGRVLLAALALMTRLGVAVSAQPLTGGSFALTGGVASGGGTSKGDSLSMTGWAASAGAGVSTGNTYALTCGLLGFYALTATDIVMNVERTPVGHVRLWWPAEVSGYQLEFSVGLGSAMSWQSVTPSPIGNSYTVEPLNSARFFRLRQP